MKTRVLLYATLALVVAHPVLAQRGDKAYPVDAATMVKYPELTKGELTPIKVAKLDLKGEFLEDTMTVFNLIHSVDRYAYEVLQKGTFVYVDKDRNVRYKGDCANRIEKANNCPKCLEIIATLRADSVRNAAAKASPLTTATASKPGWFANTLGSIWDFFWTIFIWIGKAVLVLAAVALGLLALFLIGLLIGWLIRELLRLFERSARPVTPAPVAPIVPVPVPTPAPAPAIVLPTRHEVHLFYEGGAHIVLPSSRT